MRNKYPRSLTGRVARGLFWTFFLGFLLLPLIWMVLVSVQSLNGLSNKYSIIPEHITLQGYKAALLTTGDIRSALIYSTYVSAVSSIIAMTVALASAYLVTARVLSFKWRRQIVITALGLFFLPAFAVYPGVRQLERFFPSFDQHHALELIATQSIQVFPVAFILLLLLFKSLSRTDFEQLLLETRSRVKAFWWGIVARNSAGVVAIATLTFAAVWSDFYVTGFITMRDKSKPFSVLLQFTQGQYATDYSAAAAGAVVSMIITLGSVGMGYLIIIASRHVRRRDWRATP
jgi:ABC-type glycerol-3-phosphate transport system permease component